MGLGEDEVWLQGHVKSMVAMELGGRGGRRLEVRCLQVVRWQMVKGTHAA